MDIEEESLRSLTFSVASDQGIKLVINKNCNNSIMESLTANQMAMISVAYTYIMLYTIKQAPRTYKHFKSK